MNPSSQIPFAESKQERSQKTLEDILEAAEQIVVEANPDFLPVDPWRKGRAMH